jgi:hypothetical protein
MESSRSAQPQRLVSTSRAFNTSAPELAFVSITQPDETKDRNLRRKIHRHVMKNIGLTRRRRPRKEQIALNLISEKPTSPNPESDKTVLPRQFDKPIRHTSNLHSQRSLRLALSQLSLSRFPSPALIAAYTLVLSRFGLGDFSASVRKPTSLSLFLFTIYSI